jgi:endo-1,4-beta-D-glucanase Y
MAMALLMAEQQWGDAAYRKEAEKIIDALLKDLIRKDGSIRLGDWQQAHGNDSPASTRTSDFEIASFRAFHQATGNDQWLKVVERCFAILNQLQADYAPKTGLLPDFALQQKDGTWKPAHPKFLEGHNDGNYGYNACRVPWRIGFSAIYSNDEKSKKIAKRLMNWIVSAHDSPAEFKAGYKLNGTPTTQSSKMVFTAPTGVTAMATGNRDWLDGTFRLAAKTTDSYFSDSVNLICLLIMSENYWFPEY